MNRSSSNLVWWQMLLKFTFWYWSLHSRSQECKKVSTFAAIISQSFQTICMEFGILLRLVGVMNVILFNIQERESYFCDFVIKKPPTFSVDFYSDIYWPISFKLGVLIENTKLCILIPVSKTLTFIQGHSCVRNHKLRCPFSQNSRCRFRWNFVCVHNVLACWSSG